jgi:hypothetical protein
MLPLPEDPDFSYLGPYLLSPDKNKAIASVSFKKSENYGPYSYVLGDLAASKIVAVRKDAELFVDAVAWSPDSKFVALLRKKQVSVLHGPMEILSACAGHPVQYSDYFLEIIDAQGKLVARTKVAGPTAGTWGEVVWTAAGTSNPRSHADAREEVVRAGEAGR